MDTQTAYQEAVKFAALKHGATGQTIPGSTLPYVVHLSNVAMEILVAAHHTPGFQTAFAVQLALLHDVLEDTPTTRDELAAAFGPEVAAGVAALTKDESLRKAARMIDSLNRIKQLQAEVWAVKLADRITNLQAPPPHWTEAKKSEYLHEARLIAMVLKGGNAYLEKRLEEKILNYALF